MNTTTRKHRIATLLSVIGALLILGGTAQAATSKPAGMSNVEYRALMLRSEALNKKYHLGRYSPVPQGMTATAYRALMLRSEALNKKYHLGRYSPVPQGMTATAYRALMLRSEALNRKYHLGRYSPVPQGMTATAYRALMLRSEALNRKYHLGAFAPATRVETAAAGFSWSAFGIGVAAMLGLVLLASGAIVGRRHGWRAPRTRISS